MPFRLPKAARRAAKAKASWVGAKKDRKRAFRLSALKSTNEKKGGEEKNTQSAYTFSHVVPGNCRLAGVDIFFCVNLNRWGESEIEG